MCTVAKLYVLYQIINTHNNKEEKSISRSVRSNRNVYREKLDCQYNQASNMKHFENFET